MKHVKNYTMYIIQRLGLIVRPPGPRRPPVFLLWRKRVVKNDIFSFFILHSRGSVDFVTIRKKAAQAAYAARGGPRKYTNLLNNIHRVIFYAQKG